MAFYDVVIVGGGPAGSSCAWGLRNSGLKVAVLDKQIFPRDKICGGWITPAVLADLEINPAEYAQGRVLQPISGFRIGVIGDSPIETTYSEPVSFGIVRREFDQYLLRRSGVETLLGTPLTSLKRDANGWIVNNNIRTRLIVGAGGHFCPVARLLGGKDDGVSPVVAQEVEFKLDASQRASCRIEGEVPELYFCRDMKGYGWCFRKGGVLNVGLGRADPLHLPQHVTGFLEFLRRTGRVSFEIPRLHGHAYFLNGTSPRTVAGEGYLLVGDAAGLAYLQSGEGILPAVESGLLAAKDILAHSFDSYPVQIAAPAPTPLMKFGSSLPSPLIGFLARNLFKTQWFVRNVVLQDWFLHSQTGNEAH